jgi:hypothetical protein
MPFVYGVAVFGALLGIVAIARLTRRPLAPLVRISVPPAPARPTPRFLDALLRGPVGRGVARALARIALRRLAASPRLTEGTLLPVLASAASALSNLNGGSDRSFSEQRRGEARWA